MISDLDRISPVEQILIHEIADAKIKLYLKRDDLIHPLIEGNKFRKLKYNLKEILDNQILKVVTFGGAYSNHLLATSQAGKIFGFKSKGVLNSNYADPENYTLAACLLNGMELEYCDKIQFKEKTDLYKFSKEFYYLPEGGSNELALKGCAEIFDEIRLQIPDVTHIVCPMGTGGTIAGMLDSSDDTVKIIAIPVLKYNASDHLKKTFPQIKTDNLLVWADYHFGGYARIKDNLISFILNWYERTGIVTDPVYNGKALFGLMDKINSGYFPQGSHVVYVHTGGSQGIHGMNKRFNLNLPVK